MTESETYFWQHVTITEACWLWTGSTLKGGYGSFWIRAPVRHKVLAHRFSWELHKMGIPEHTNVLHSCDTPACVNPGHLFLGTQQDNVTDMIVKGRKRMAYGDRNGARLYPERITRGERRPHTKLKESQIPDIRKAYPVMSLSKLSSMYGVSKETIRKIVHRQKWSHVL